MNGPGPSPRGRMKLTPEMVRLCHRVEADPGPGPGFTPMTEAEAEAATDRLLGEAHGPVRVFAYGSLIWNPGFDVAESLRGKLHGWHRSFNIRLTRWRGSMAQPGLMLGLEHGGSCAGMILRLPEASLRADLLTLVKREIPHREGAGMVRWSSVETASGMERALVFWAGPTGPDIEHRLPLETVAQRLAHACGHGGSGAEYLYNTVEHLEAAGIRDRNLWRLQALMAEEIVSWSLPARRNAG